jgi:hypothetical protein
MMSKEQIQDYRVNAYPNEVDLLMAKSIQLAAKLDESKDDSSQKVFDEYRKTLKDIIERSEYYYKKRKRDFGIEHMKLMRLIFATKEALRDAG